MASGWRLAPAFDMNPAPDVVDHALAIDDHRTRPDVRAAVDTAELYRLSPAAAERIVAEVREVVATWKERARGLDLSRGEIALVAPAFEGAA